MRFPSRSANTARHSSDFRTDKAVLDTMKPGVSNTNFKNINIGSELMRSAYCIATDPRVLVADSRDRAAGRPSRRWSARLAPADAAAIGDRPNRYVFEFRPATTHGYKDIVASRSTPTRHVGCPGLGVLVTASLRAPNNPEFQADHP